MANVPPRPNVGKRPPPNKKSWGLKCLLDNTFLYYYSHDAEERTFEYSAG